MKKVFYIKFVLLICIGINSYAAEDSVLTLIEKSSYQSVPQFPDSLDIMYNNPLEWIREGLRTATNSVGNDLEGYALLLKCDSNGTCKCLKSTGPDQKKLLRMVSYINTVHLIPWTDILPSPITLLISWSVNSCYIERLMGKTELKKDDSRLFVRKWKGFPYFNGNE